MMGLTFRIVLPIEAVSGFGFQFGHDHSLTVIGMTNWTFGAFSGISRALNQ